MENKIKTLSSVFFENFWIKFDNLEIIEAWENKFKIKILSEESSILIWKWWKNLDAINSILQIILKKNINPDFKFFLEINDYSSSKDEKLKNFIISKIKILQKTWEDIILPYFSPYERKKIHDIVADYPDENIFTKSIWEEEERRIHLCKIEKKLTIDIDWLDI